TPTPPEVTPPPRARGAPPPPPAGPGGPAAPTQSAPAAPAHAPAGPAAPGVPPGYQTPPPGYQTPPPGYPAQPGYQTPPPGYVPGYPAPSPSHHPGYPPPAPQRKPKGLIIAGVVVAAVIGLAVLGSLLPDNSGDKAKGGTSSAGGSTNSAAPGSGSQAKGGKRADPTPASYQGVNLTANYQLMLADNPPRPVSGGNAGVMYNHGDFYFYIDTLFGDTKVGTDNGKLVVLNNSQKGSLETCRAETRYTEKIGLDQLTDGSEICVLSDAGHIAVVTYRGRSGAKDPSSYITLDLTVWRNAEEPKKGS
ncbi:serine/threonine protein kinase, partial [Streptomyces sp. NPDC059761]